MDHPVQNSPTTLRELLVRVHMTARQAAEAIGVNVMSLRGWGKRRRRRTRGYWKPELATRWEIRRPLFENVVKVARLFNIDVESAVLVLWKEKVGELCECGCGSKKILPDCTTAKHLYFEIVCEKCGKGRIRRTDQHHRSLCRNCAKSKGTIEVPCIGYRLFSERPRFAKNCSREVVIRRSYWRPDIRAREDDGERAFIDEVKGIGRCSRCAQTARGYRRREEDVRTFLDRAVKSAPPEARQNFFNFAGFHPHERFPKIQSFQRLVQIQKACMKLAHRNNEGDLIAFPGSQHFRPAAPGRLSRLRSEAERKSHSIGAFVMWAKKGKLSRVRGLCQLCGKLLFSSRAGNVRFHRSCSLPKVSTKGVHRFHAVETLKARGRPANLETLRKQFSWFVRHNLGAESLEEIAKTCGIKKQSVAEGISYIVDRLPDEKLIPADQRKRMFWLTV